jgi:cytochrome bd-type quinol oxidase subunit 2
VKGEHLSIIRLTRITKTFVWGDFFTLGIQGGAVNLTTKDKTAKLGENLIVVGLCMQLALLGFFFMTAAVFHKRLRKQPTIESSTTSVWKSTLYMIYAVSALIFFRSVFRVIEFLQGTDGYSLRNEWTLYVFDAAPMFVVTVVYFWWYPGFLLRAQESEERFELVEEGRVKSDRPLIRS